MKACRRCLSTLLAVSFLILLAVALSSGQSQPQIPAQTQPQTKTETQPETKAKTQDETKANTRVQAKANTLANPQQTLQQKQQAVPDTIRKMGKRTTRGGTTFIRCRAITENGTRCTRRALPGSTFCRQHGGK
jgi:hypothetical protein